MTEGGIESMNYAKQMWRTQLTKAQRAAPPVRNYDDIPEALSR